MMTSLWGWVADEDRKKWMIRMLPRDEREESTAETDEGSNEED